uniref:Uncharacterized protein n=1 Tax=Brassica oleracea TaxID=3712 RepID=A0A3P6END5_BRAOL|nr:unnamed protein product [Brassica oleracea]
MAKRDEQHGFGEPSKVEEVDTSDPTSLSIDSSTSKSINIGTSETIDTSTATPIDSMTLTSTNVTTSTSIDGTTSESIAHTIPSSIDGDSCFRTRPLEIPESLNCPQDIAESAQKSIDISSCDPTSDGDREITMEDFLELEEFLELEDEEKVEDLDSSREVTMEDFLELKEWLEDMDHNSQKKLDDDQHTSRGDLETSKASIDQHQPDEIDRHQPCIIDKHPPFIIVRNLPDGIDLHPPDIIDRHPLLDEPHGFIIEMEPIEERVHESEASYNADSKHLRPLICAEEAAGIHKKMKMIHDPVKIVVPCAVFEAESPIPPDRSMQFTEAASVDTDRIPSNDTNKPTSIDITTSPSIDTGRISEQKEFDVRGNLKDGDTTTQSDKSGGKKRRNWKKRKRIKDGPQISLIPCFSDVFIYCRSKKKDPRKTSLHEDRRWLCSIDRQSITSIDRSSLNCVDRQSFKSIDRHLAMMVATHIKIRYTVFPC